MADVVDVGWSLIDIRGDRRVVGAGPSVAPGGSLASMMHWSCSARGLRIERHLDKAGVRLLAGSLIIDANSTAQATLDSSGSATYAFDIPWELPRLMPSACPRSSTSVQWALNRVEIPRTGLIGVGRADFSIAPTLALMEVKTTPGDGTPARRTHLERLPHAGRALRPGFAGWESRTR